MQEAESRVVIIGGGLAGLAAATALAVRRIPAVVLESRTRLGGRASSFHDPATGSDVDNCQHVAMGCCVNFRHFIRTLGLEACFRRERMLYFIGPSGKPDRFAATNWPCPFHLAGAFRRLSYLTVRDKYAIARGLSALTRSPGPHAGLSFLDWLQAQRQPRGAIDGFWQVVLVSALSETLDRIAVPEARKVFVDGFLKHRDGWTVEIPTVPLAGLYGPRLLDWLAARGVDVRLQAGVEKLRLASGRIASVRLRSGEDIPGADFISTVPWGRLADLLPEELACLPSVQDLSRLESAPITSIHLWFDRPITDLPHAVLVGRVSQWMFHRSALSAATPLPVSAPPEPAATHYYQVVISASHNLSQQAQTGLLATVLDELAAIWPVTRSAVLVHQRIVTEHKAVISVRPGSEALRPAQQSPVDNFQWAGDWTKTGWPGTMEGAVRSGYLAVENILSRRGRAEAVLQPDLPTAFWSRWLLGIA